MFGAELLLDLNADRWVLYSFKKLCETSVGNPWWQARSQRRSPCNVGIHVGRDILSGIARGLNHSNNLRHRAPTGFSDHLQMKNLDRQMSIAANSQRLRDSGYLTLAFAAHVSAVNASVLCSDFGQFDQFGSFGVLSWRIDKRSRNSECTLLHRLCDKSFHLLELFGSRRPTNVAKDRLSDLGRANVGADVQWSA